MGGLSAALPAAVVELVDELMAMPGALAVVLGGSRATATGDDDSDWDLDAVEHWARRAEQGEFEIDALLGYVAGVPTYLLSAKLASCRTLRGEIPAAPCFAQIPVEPDGLLRWVDGVAGQLGVAEYDTAPWKT
jgi:hypothetical protein